MLYDIKSGPPLSTSAAPQECSMLALHYAAERKEFNGTTIIFIGQSIQKLLMRTLQSTTMRSTQREQTIVESAHAPMMN